MKSTFATICILGLATFTVDAHTLPEDGPSGARNLGEAATSRDAVDASEALREVVQTIAHDEDGEYIFEDLCNKTIEALKKAANKVVMSIQGDCEKANCNITEATKDARRQIRDKATVILSNLLTKLALAESAMGDSEFTASFVELMANGIL